MFHRNTEASLGQPQQQNHDSYISKSRPLLSGGAATSFSPRSKSRQKQCIQLLLNLTPIVVLLWLLLRWFQQGTASSPAYTHAPVLISYAYFEKDTIQQFNFDYFLQAGKQPSPTGQRISWFFVVSTDQCGPCSIYLNTLIPRDALPEIGAKSVASSANGDTVLMHRTQNTGMDIGSHNVTLSYLKLKRT